MGQTLRVAWHGALMAVLLGLAGVGPARSAEDAGQAGESVCAGGVGVGSGGWGNRQTGQSGRWVAVNPCTVWAVYERVFGGRSSRQEARISRSVEEALELREQIIAESPREDALHEQLRAQAAGLRERQRVGESIDGARQAHNAEVAEAVMAAETQLGALQTVIDGLGGHESDLARIAPERRYELEDLLLELIVELDEEHRARAALLSALVGLHMGNG